MRALILLGGGCKGAYQVGAISHLLGEKGISYDIFGGVSVGALNSAMLAMFKTGEERRACTELLNVWCDIKTLSVKKNWTPFSILHMLWRPSLYDSSPLIDLVRTTIIASDIRASGKKLIVPAVSLNTGECRTFDHNHPFIIDAILASSAFPGMFCPIQIEGQLWTDGGLRNSSLLKSAIDMGADSIDVIMTSPANVIPSISTKPNAIDIIIRSLDMISDEMMESDLKVTQLINRLVDAKRLDKRKVNIRILRPNQRLTGNSLAFNPKSIKRMIELGHRDAIGLCE